MSGKGSSEVDEPRTGSSATYVKLAAFGLAILAVVILAQFVDIREHIQDALRWIQDHRGVGAIAFIGMYILATVFALPGSILTLAGGAIFGLGLGFVLVSVGSTLGATGAFVVGRYLARDFVARRVSRNKTFRAVDDAVAEEGWKIVFLTRLSPVIPFNLQNFGYGLTRVRLGPYMLASWIGMMPGTVMYVYFGAAVGNLAALLAGERESSPLQWVLFGVGLLATIGVTVYVTTIARRKLTREVDADFDAEDGA